MGLFQAVVRCCAFHAAEYHLTFTQTRLSWNAVCAGLGNRMLSVVTGMLMALMTQRCFFLRHDTYLRWGARSQGPALTHSTCPAPVDHPFVKISILRVSKDFWVIIGVWFRV